MQNCAVLLHNSASNRSILCMPKIMKRENYNEGIGKTFNLIFADPLKSKISKHHKKVLRDVNEDVNDMIEYRRPAVKNAEEAILGYMALSLDVKPGRSKFFPPVLHAMVYTRMALEAASMPNVVYKHRHASSEPLMKFINAARRHAEQGDGDMRPPSLFCWYQQCFDQSLFGVGFRHLSYLLHKRLIHVKDDQGKWRERTAVVYDDIWDEHLSFFHTGVSRGTLPGMFGGTSAYNDKFYRRERFAKMFVGNENYFNAEVALEKFKGEEFIRFRRYWNLDGDLFFCQAMSADDEMSEENRVGIPMREDYILEYGPPERPQKMIPITSLHGDFNFDMRATETPNFTQDGRQYNDLLGPSNRQTFWTMGQGQIARGCIGIKRSLYRAAHDNMKASTVFFAMAQSPGVLNQIKRADLYGIVPLKADERSFNVKALIARDQAFAGIQEYDEAVENIAAGALGDDWRQSAAMLTNEKATVAAIRENIKSIRGKQRQGMNEAGPFHRHYRLLLALIQQHYPEQTEVELTNGKVPEGTDEQDIIRDSDGHPISIKKYKEIPYDEFVSVKVENGKVTGVEADDEEGKKMIPLRRELIVTPEEPEIYIEPGSTFAQLKAIERALDLERLQAYQPYFQLAYPNKDTGMPEPVIGRSGAEALLEESAEVWDSDPDKLLGRDQQKEDRPEMKRPYSGQSQEKPLPPPQAVTPATPMLSASQRSPGKGIGANGNALARALMPGG